MISATTDSSLIPQIINLYANPVNISDFFDKSIKLGLESVNGDNWDRSGDYGEGTVRIGWEGDFVGS